MFPAGCSLSAITGRGCGLAGQGGCRYPLPRFPYLDSDPAAEAVAAAALTAAQCPGGPAVDSPYAPEEPLPGLTHLRGLAARALDRVLTGPSELRDLWDEADGGPWRESILRLRRTLEPRPARVVRPGG